MTREPAWTCQCSSCLCRSQQSAEQQLSRASASMPATSLLFCLMMGGSSDGKPLRHGPLSDWDLNLLPSCRWWPDMLNEHSNDLYSDSSLIFSCSVVLCRSSHCQQIWMLKDMRNWTSTSHQAAMTPRLYSWRSPCHTSRSSLSCLTMSSSMRDATCSISWLDPMA